MCTLHLPSWTGKHLFLRIVLLSCNLHTMQFTHIKYIVPWFLIFTHTYTQHHSPFYNIFITSKRNPVLCYQSPIPPPPQPLETMNLLAVFIHLPVLDISYKWNRPLWSSVTGFRVIHLAYIRVPLYYGEIIFLYMIYHSVSIQLWTFGLFEKHLWVF